MTKSLPITHTVRLKKKKSLRFKRVAEPTKVGERKLVVINKDADRARNLERVTLNRRRNANQAYPLNRQQIADSIIHAQRNRK